MRKALLSHVLMPAAAAFTPFKSWAFMKEMCAGEFESLQRQRMWRMNRIRELLVHAYRETELYRVAMDSAGLDPVEVSYPRTFARVPITSKAALREGFPDRQLARSHRGRGLRSWTTSGTTGQPLRLFQDARDISYRYASILRSRVVAEVDPMASLVRIAPNECMPYVPGGPGPRGLSGSASEQNEPRSTRTALLGFVGQHVVNPLVHRRQVLPPFWSGPDDTSAVDYDAYLEQIRRYSPEVLGLHPLYAVLLCKHIRRTGVAPPPIGRLVDLSGGVCTPKMSAFIAETFGVRTAQSCGGCEFSRFGSSCPDDPDRMHLAESYAYVEAIRPDGEICAPGELGNLIVTSLHSWAMPVIRLEPGDVGRIIEAPCRCGRRSRRLQHGGRTQGLIHNVDGRWVTTADVWDALILVPGMELFQLQQHREDLYDLQVVAEPGAEPDAAALSTALETLLGTGARVRQKRVDAIRPENSGKLLLVKSNTYEAFRPASVRGG